MQHSPSFSIIAEDDILRVTLKGTWSLAQDMAYLTSLSDAIDQIKAKPWGLLVDMREWQLDETTQQRATGRHVANVNMDRRNQKAECWLVKQPSQGQSLIQFIPQTLPFLRVTDKQQARVWFKEYALYLGS